MSYAIIRVAKIKTEQAAIAKTAHNYRQKQVPNADEHAPHPNREYLNKGQIDYWTLATQRIDQVVKRKTRGDQVRAMEIIMTRSPEAFKRDQKGRVIDYSKSKWAQDNLIFLQEKFGKENVLSFTLHQDEKTPHIHAVITPITSDNRLSAKDLFGREQLVQLQTDYAKVMEPYGVSRGVKHSQAKHQPMSRRYGIEQASAEQVAKLTSPITLPDLEPFKLSDPPVIGRDAWKKAEEERINRELTRVIKEANERLEKAGKVAQDNTAASEQVKILQKQLNTSESLKQTHYNQVQEQGTSIIQSSVRIAQGEKEAITELIQIGKEYRENVKAKLVNHIEELLKGSLPTMESLIKQLDPRYKTTTYEGELIIADKNTRSLFIASELTPNGQAFGPQLAAAIKRDQAQEEEPKKKKGLRPS